jgi:hypothetical protein
LRWKAQLALLDSGRSTGSLQIDENLRQQLDFPVWKLAWKMYDWLKNTA